MFWTRRWRNIYGSTSIFTNHRKCRRRTSSIRWNVRTREKNSCAWRGCKLRIAHECRFYTTLLHYAAKINFWPATKWTYNPAIFISFYVLQVWPLKSIRNLIQICTDRRIQSTKKTIEFSMFSSLYFIMIYTFLYMNNKENHLRM